MDYEKNIEIPFGAHDSELKSWEYTIPEGMEAIIKDGKVIVREKESKDERIRRQLINVCNDWLNGDYSASPCLNDIKWLKNLLEKQKDASKAIEAVDRIYKYIEVENVANAHDMNDSNPNKKYYCGWNDALGKIAGILQDVYSNEKQKEQKPAEWSEGDEERIQSILFSIGYCKDEYPNKKDYSKDIDWLKSLRPSWKPSEKQIDTIVEALKYLPNNKNEWMILNTLVDALRKLM